MKNVLLVLLMTLLGAGAQADHINSQFKLKLWDDSRFIVEINGQPMQERGESFRSPMLPPGFHQLRVFELRGSKHHPVRRMVYQGEIETRPFMLTKAKLYRHRYIEVKGFKHLKSYDGHHGGGYGYGGGNHGGYGNGHGTGNSCGMALMSPHQYANLIADISCAYYDMERVRIIRSVARRSAFTSYQILGLVASVRNEDHKLMIAKELFYNVVDKENYHYIRDAFSYRYSKRNFDIWLSAQLF